MYFNSKVLKLKERRVYEIENHDVGNILHLVLERFTGVLMKDFKTAQDEKQLNAAVSSIVEQAAAECVNSILLSDERYLHFKNRLNATAQRSCRIMAEHLNRSEFRIAAAEAEFGGDKPLVFMIDDQNIIELSGRVDRIDKAEFEGRQLVCVIDYKTGSRRFSFKDLWYGLQLQLVVYLMAALAQESNQQAAGLMYFKVANPVLPYVKGMNREVYQKEMQKRFRMSGVTSSHTEIIKKLDRNAADGDMLPVILTGGGNEISKRSIALDESGFQALINNTAARIKEIGAGILSGNVAASPLKHRDNLPCRYCNYPAVCGRGKDDEVRQMNKLSEQEALRLILE
jgi:ATP-dependent helicase/nuclease subunit B